MIVYTGPQQREMYDAEHTQQLTKRITVAYKRPWPSNHTLPQILIADPILIPSYKGGPTVLF